MTGPFGRAANGELFTSYTARVDAPEVMWRYGYTCYDSSPLLLGSSGDKATAEKRAMLEAAKTSQKLSELHARPEVEWWIQPVSITAIAEFEDPAGVLLSEDERAELLAQEVR